MMAAVKCSHGEVWPLERFRPHPRNPNKHPAEQLRLLGKVIMAHGWRSPIVVSERSGYVIKGHGRLEAARLAGMETAPVDLQDYAGEVEELADMVADNRLSELAEMSLPELKDILEGLDTGALDMESVGFSESALAELMSQFRPASDVDAEPQIDRAEELREKWGVKLGDHWRLGDHMLICGDATRAEIVAALFDEKPHLMVTDPPYGVEYDAKWRNEALPAGPDAAGRAIGAVANDDRSDWRAAWELFPGDVVYVWHGGVRAKEVQESLTASGFAIRSQIIWAKQQFAIGRGDYHWQHEPCWYAVREGKPGHFNGDRTQTTLWQIDKPQKSETGHSTQKPVECMARPVRNNSKVGELVYDPFLGSGTTLIACEQLGRRCRAIELNPGYVAVTLQRFADATGKTPTLIAHG